MNYQRPWIKSTTFSLILANFFKALVYISRELAKRTQTIRTRKNKKITSLGGHAAKVARTDIENSLRKSIISEKNVLDYRYRGENKQIESK